MKNYILRDLETGKNISQILKEEGLQCENKVVEQKIIESNYYISKQLNVSLATKLFYLEKIRWIEGKPCSIEKVYVPLEEVKGMESMDFNNVSFYSILNKEKHIHTLQTDEEILLVEANEWECEVLNLKAGDEILLTKGRTKKENGKILEYFELSSIPELYRFRSVSKL